MKPTRPAAPINRWLAEPLSREVASALERLAGTDDVVQVAVMPDVHLAKEVCVGVALATDSSLFPEAVGGDIGCGMAAIGFDCEAELLAKRSSAAVVMSDLYARIPITKHGKNHAAGRAHPALDEPPLSHSSLEKHRRRDGALQLGTLGRGNHFIEFQADDHGALWLMVHSGSRAMGQAVQAHHLKRAARTSSGLATLPAQSAEGEAYLNDMRWALAYAAANREAMVEAVVGIMAERFRVLPRPSSAICCHHNFVEREQIGGRLLWIHRKGAISARHGEAGLVPGSMGTSSFHVLGRGCDDSLCSSSHGAGRAMSRGEARRRISVRALEKQLAHVWFDQRMAARLVDEAPSAYKDISAVMRAQRDLTQIVRELRPVLTFKGAGH